MPPKAGKVNKKEDKDRRKNNKDSKDKKDENRRKNIPKRTCTAPIAVGEIMTQRVLPPTVCCPPAGCCVSYCLPEPGCRR